MSIRDLFFKISAKDDTAQAFASVRKGLGGIEGAARQMRDRFAGIGRAARNAGGVMAVSFTAPITLAMRNSLTLFQQQEKAQALVTDAIRRTGGAAGFTADELFRQASALQDLSAVGDETILADVTQQLLTFGNVSGETFTRAQQAALDLSATIGSDLRSTTISLGKALNDPVRGLTALGRQGIQFSEDQKAVIKALAETGQVAEAQKIILDEIAQFYGGAAAASAGTLSGQIQGLSNAWGDLQEQFGAVIAELLPPLISGLRGIIAAFQATPEPIKRMVVAAGAVAAVLGPIVGVVGLLTIGLAGLSAPVLAAGAAIAGLSAAFLAFGPEIARIATLVGDFGGAVLDTLMEGLGAARDFVLGTVRQMGEAFDWLYETVVGSSSVPDLVDGVLAEFVRLDRGAVSTATGTAAEIGGIFDQLAQGVVRTFTDMAQQGSFSVRGLAQGLLGVGASVAGGIVSSGLNSLAGMATDALSGAIGGGASGLAASIAGGGASAPAVTASRGFSPVTVNIATPDPQAFRASQAQIATSLSRAVARGQGQG